MATVDATTRAKLPLGRWPDDRPSAAGNGSAASAMRRLCLLQSAREDDVGRVRRGRRPGRPRVAGAGVCAGRPLRRVGDERAGVGAAAVRHGADRRGAGQHQSRVPDERTEIRAAPVGRPRAGARRCLQVVELFRHAQRSLSGARGGCARRTAKRDVSETAVGRVAARRAAARHAVMGRTSGSRRTTCRKHSSTKWPPDSVRTTRSTFSTPPARPGSPKGAMLSHRNILLNAFYAGECQQLDHTDRICLPVPLYHCFGCVLGTLCCVRSRLGDGVSGRKLSARRDAGGHRTASAAPRSTACPRCSSPSWSTRTIRGAICRRCGPGSWPAARARSR